MKQLWLKLRSRALGREFLKALSYLYDAVLAIKRWRGQGLLVERKASAPVISIGNLTVGGSGKTTMALYMAKRLFVDGRHVCILTRGYRGGDEARMMRAQSVLGGFDLDVVVGANRRERALEYWRAADVSKRKRLVFLMDDGHQHETLKKDFSIVLFDAMDFSGHQALLPDGLLREPMSFGLARADAAVLTHADLVGRQRLDEWHAILKKWAPHQPIFEAIQLPSGCRDILGGEALADLSQEKSVYLVSGIGNPESFEEILKRHSRWRIMGHWKFEDHVGYDERTISRISQEAERLGASLVVTTPKDAVKIVSLVRRLIERGFRLQPWAQVEIVWMFQGSGQEERFWGLVDNALAAVNLKYE